MIPMVDLKQQYQNFKSEIDQSVMAVLESGYFILGPNVKALEEEVAEYLNVPYAVSVASGTDALNLSLAAIDLKPGDEVITTPFTFFATAETICYFGAKPVFVDIDPHTFNLDVSQVEAAITDKTRAIIPVHLFGHPTDMTALSKFNLEIIEDCAQSFGATFDGKQTGAFGTTGCFSFFPSKNLGAYGDAGLISTHSKEIADKLLMLRNHGSNVRYHHDAIGYNSRLDEMQAAILRIKLKHINEFNENRRNVAKQYCEQLADLPIQLPTVQENVEHVFHQFTLLSDKRDEIGEALKQENIASAVYYPIPLHKQPVFEKTHASISLPVSENVASQCISLPIFPEMTSEQITKVCNVIKERLNA